MNPAGERILEHLQTVARERALRATSPGLEERVLRLKAYQQARFRRGYADLLGHPRYDPAALFFLQDLYGPDDFTSRDAQFVRIVPPLVKLFPDEIVQTVETLAQLHALSERLDTAMAGHLDDAPLAAKRYVEAWQATGMPDDRAAQVALTLQVGRSLDRFTRNTVIRHSLRLMRGPARAAGLSALQTFLERGFDTFRSMRGAGEFLATIGRREEALRLRLFAADVAALPAGPTSFVPDVSDPLGQLP